MTAETSKTKAKLANLNASLGELESLLEPLLAQSLPETLVGLEPIQQAKLQTVLPYLVYDLVYIYLKAKGIDPKTHPVVSELDRVRQYFEKIAIVENPPIKRTEVDKDAAERFIKHAISQASVKQNPLPPLPPLPSASTPAPVKVTTKMIARAQYQRTLEKERQEQGEKEEEALQMYDEPDPAHSSVDGGHDETVESRENATPTPPPSKRKRQAIDPFTGYGEQMSAQDPDILSKTNSASTADVAPSATPKDRKTRKKKKSKKLH